MYHHIVVAVDGSNTSLNALKHAAVLANAGNAKLTLLTVANPGEYMTLGPEFLQHDSYEEAAVSSGNEVLAEASLMARNEGVQHVETHLLVATRGEKEMAQELVDYADAQGAAVDAHQLFLGGRCRFNRHRHTRPHRPDAPADGQLCRNRDAPKPLAAARHPQPIFGRGRRIIRAAEKHYYGKLD